MVRSKGESSQENFQSENFDPFKCTWHFQVTGKLQQNPPWLLAQYFLSSSLASFSLSAHCHPLCSQASPGSSLILTLNLKFLPFFWTRFWFCVWLMLFCCCFGMIFWIINWFPLGQDFNNCVSAPNAETMAMKFPSHLSVGRLGWSVLLFSVP